MGCYICDRQIDDVKIDHRDMKTAPCGTCEAAIQECIDGYPKLEGEVDEDIVVSFEPELEEFEDVYASALQSARLVSLSEIGTNH